LSLALAVAPVVARSAPAKDARARAKRLTAEGTAAYKAKKYAVAVEKLREALQLAPSPALLLNLSRAEVRLSRCGDAFRHAEMSRAQSSGAEQDTAEAWLATLETECVEAQVDSTPPGAAIAVDGEPQSAPDKTPWKGHLSPGSHIVSLSLPGYADATGTLEVSATAPAQLSMKLTPLVKPGAPPASLNAPAPAPATRTLPPGAVSSTPPAEGPAHPMSWQRTVGIAAAAVGVAVLAAGVGMGVVSHQQQTEVRTTINPAATNVSLEHSSNALAAGADASFAVGGVLAAAGVGLIVVF
jgi:hypothetical protein